MFLRKVLGSLRPGSHFGKRSIAPSLRANSVSPLGRRRLRLEPLEDRQMLSITLFVDADSTAQFQDGLDWTHAYTDLQAALTRAAELNADGIANNDVEAIWIAEGTYCPTAELESGDVRSASFSLVDGVSLYGGFAGTETSLDQRDLSVCTTILSGDLGVSGDVSDNAYTVVYCGENIVATLDGLAITDGYASGAEDASHLEKDSGGGIYNSGNLTLSNVSLLNNYAISNGGAIYNNSEGQLFLENTSVAQNLAYCGAGIFNDGLLKIGSNSKIFNNSAVDSSDYLPSFFVPNNDSEFTLSVVGDSIFANNPNWEGSIGILIAPGCGGGIYNNGIAEVSNSTISENQSACGGGILNHGQLQIENVIFQENVAFYGGGVANHGELEVVGSQFQGNVASYPNYYGICGASGEKGGGIYNHDTGVVNIANSLFTQNRGGGGIVNHGHMSIVSSTITQNSAKEIAGGISSRSGAITELYNTIVAENKTYREYDFRVMGPDATPIGKDVAGAFIGSNNLIGNGTGLLNLTDGIDGNQIGTAESPIDPGLSITTKEETGLIQYELLSDSPAIDAGANNLAVDPDGNALTTDLYGNARVSGNAVDIGAVEAVTSSSPVAQTYVVTSLENTIAEDGVLTFLEAFLAANSNHAVGDAQAGSYLEQDVIQFADGLQGTIVVDGELVISDDLCIEGSGVNLITFDAQGQNRVFTVATDTAVTLSGITITGGSDDNGGGIYNLGTLTVTNCVISDNTVNESGGGIYNAGILTVTNSSILNNSTPEEYSCLVPYTSSYICFACRGGGVYNAGGDLTVTNSTIAGNSAVYGGGICNDGGGYGGTLTVTNSTILDNDAFGICNISILSPVPCGQIELNNSIVAGNALADVITFSPRYTGDLPPSWEEGCLVAVSRDSLESSFSHHIGPFCFLVKDWSGGSFSGSNNLIGYTSTEANLVNGVDGNQVGTADAPVDPMLSELVQFVNGQYGYYPLADSPVIDAGNNDLLSDGVTADIAGNERIYNGTVDIGACESVPVIVTVVDVDDVSLIPEGEVLPVKRTSFTPPTNFSPGKATVPRRSELPPRQLIRPVSELTDVVFAESVSEQALWSSDDLAAIAKEFQMVTVEKTTDESENNPSFALELGLYADLG